MSSFPRPLSLLAPAAVALVFGCSAPRNDDQARDTGETDDTATESGDDTGWDSDAPSMDSPAWFKLDGTLVIAEGEAVPGSSTLQVQFIADAEDTGQDTGTTGVSRSCTTTPALESLTEAVPSDTSLQLLGWWLVTLDQTEDATCPWDLPQNLHLGVGALDTDLYPAMDVNGFDTSASTLYGLYTQYGAADAPIWIFGVAGTLENYTGTAEPADAAPLPDGSYDLETLHLLPWYPASR